MTKIQLKKLIREEIKKLNESKEVDELNKILEKAYGANKYLATRLVKILEHPKSGKEVEIFKIKKVGTKREFFQPWARTKSGLSFLTKTFFARMYDAKEIAKMYFQDTKAK